MDFSTTNTYKDVIIFFFFFFNDHQTKIETFQNHLTEASRLIVSYSSSQKQNYIIPMIAMYEVVECTANILLDEKEQSTQKVKSSSIENLVKSCDSLPIEVQTWLNTLLTKNKDEALSCLDRQEFLNYVISFKIYIIWFLHESIIIKSYSSKETKNQIKDALKKLTSISTKSEDLYFTDANKILSSNQVNEHEPQEIANWIVEMLKTMNKQITIANIKIDGISQKLDDILFQVSECKALLSPILDNMVNANDVETIISVFSDNIIKKISSTINNDNNPELFNEIEKNLEQTFGTSWSKLKEFSKSYMITSKILFNKLKTFGDDVDYSGVCLLVSKALELELSSRFCIDYRKYIIEQFKQYKNTDKYFTDYIPKIFIGYDSSTNQNYVYKSNHFTLGNMPYLLWPFPDNPEAATQRENHDMQVLLSFCKDKLFINSDEKAIRESLHTFKDDVKKVTQDFRNPAAHITNINQTKAQDCLNFVIDVEKLLKKLLDSFKY